MATPGNGDLPGAESMPRSGMHAKAGPTKHPVKSVKERKRLDLLVLGVDVTMAEAEDFSNTVVVGHVRGRRFGRGFLHRWVSEQWMDTVSSAPEVRVLTKGWFSFIFKSQGEVKAVLSRNWSILGIPLVMKRWSPFFDSKSEKIAKEPLWVKLPGLLMHMWNETRFTKIGNYLGEYVSYDSSHIKTGIYTVAKILVNIDIRLGLSAAIKVQSKDGDFTQLLDYVGVPFRCHRCHSQSHLVACYPLPFRKSKPMSSIAADVEDVPVTKVVSPAVVDAGCGPAMDEGVNYGSDMPSLHCGRLGSEDLLPPLVNIGLEHYGKAPPVVEGDTFSFKPSSMNLELPFFRQDSSAKRSGMSTFISTAGSDLDDSMVLGGGCHGSPPRPAAHCNRPDVDCTATPTMVTSTHSSSSEGSIRYALRNREIPDCGTGGKGLPELASSVGGKGRGRKSHLSKAKERAKVDVVMGTQASIEWALRAVQAHDGGSI